MKTNQGPDRLCQAKSHVQTACESHDLNMDFLGLQTASRNEFLCKNIQSYHAELFINIFLTSGHLCLQMKTNIWFENRTKKVFEILEHLP